MSVHLRHISARQLSAAWHTLMDRLFQSTLLLPRERGSFLHETCMCVFLTIHYQRIDSSIFNGQQRQWAIIPGLDVRTCDYKSSIAAGLGMHSTSDGSSGFFADGAICLGHLALHNADRRVPWRYS